MSSTGSSTTATTTTTTTSAAASSKLKASFDGDAGEASSKPLTKAQLKAKAKAEKKKKALQQKYQEQVYILTNDDDGAPLSKKKAAKRKRSVSLHVRKWRAEFSISGDHGIAQARVPDGSGSDRSTTTSKEIRV